MRMLLFAVLAVSPVAYAQQEDPFNLGDVAEICGGLTEASYERNPNHAACIAYLQGYIGGYNAAFLLVGAKPYICLPAGSRVAQWAKVVVKYADDNPDKLHWEAPIGVHGALVQAFPCG
jgi:hypothetical protein